MIDRRFLQALKKKKSPSFPLSFIIAKLQANKTSILGGFLLLVQSTVYVYLLHECQVTTTVLRSLPSEKKKNYCTNILKFFIQFFNLTSFPFIKDKLN